MLLVVLALVVFALARLTGNPADLLLPEDATREDRAHLLAALGLDRPMHEQLGLFLDRRGARRPRHVDPLPQAGGRGVLRAAAQHARRWCRSRSSARWSSRSRSGCSPPSTGARFIDRVVERHRRARHRDAVVLARHRADLRVQHPARLAAVGAHGRARALHPARHHARRLPGGGHDAARALERARGARQRVRQARADQGAVADRW